MKLGALMLVLVACAHPPPQPRLTRDRELESLEQAVRWPNPSVPVVMWLANAWLSTQRYAEGYAYFDARAKETPERPLFEALAGVFQARSAENVPLLSRVAWVEEAIARLDRAASKDGLSLYLRGIVFVALPDRFGRKAQGVADLHWMLQNAARFPPGLQRGAREALAGRTGLLPDGSLSAKDGFRFAPPEVREPVKGIYVARGYDFADIAFVVTSEGLVAIDAGTTPATAAAALAAVRARVDLPIRKVIVTHAHWDHIGGLGAYAAPGVEVIAQSRYRSELARVNGTGAPFRWFFGASALTTYPFEPHRLVERREKLKVGGVRFDIIPVESGETDDALLIHLPDMGVTFVGDAFMPYLGAPFVAEGSVDGLLDTVARVRALGPTLLIHGHAPLTDNFPLAVLEPVAVAVASVRDATLKSLRAGRSLPEILDANPMPETLRDHPAAVLPFLLMRDSVVQRLDAQHSGYWKPDGEGMAVFADPEWGGALDLLGGEDGFVRAAATLNHRGDYAMALRLATLGLAVHRAAPDLDAQRRRALEGLRARYQFNPFKFLIYSEMAGEELPPAR